MKKNEIYSLFLIITLISFLGFMVENIWIGITKGYMNNRNMHLPFLLGYGLAIAAIYLLFGTPHNLRLLKRNLLFESKFVCTIVYFLIVCICVSVGEFILGHFVERVCGIVWWDYSWIPFHISRYTSLPTSMGFSFLITFFMYYFFEPLYDYFGRMKGNIVPMIACTMMILMIGDFIYSGIYMLKNGQTLLLWNFNANSIQVAKFVMMFIIGSGIVLVKDIFFHTYHIEKLNGTIWSIRKNK